MVLDSTIGSSNSGHPLCSPGLGPESYRPAPQLEPAVSVGVRAMPRVRETKPRPLSRAAATGAFDQYLLDIQKLPMITVVQEAGRPARLALKGDEKAAERLVTANLRFVISYVKKYQGHGLDLSELVAIGNEGLLKAVRKFDPDHGVKFISYAVWWVRQAVLKALAEQTRSGRIPLNQNSALVRMARAQSFLAQRPRRKPAFAPPHDVHRGVARRAGRPPGAGCQRLRRTGGRHRPGRQRGHDRLPARAGVHRPHLPAPSYPPRTQDPVPLLRPRGR